MIDCEIDQASKSERRRRFVPMKADAVKLRLFVGNTVESEKPVERHVKGA